MNMMTPVTGNTPATAIPPIRPVEPAQSFTPGDPGRDQPGDDRDRGSETTLRYKFDWLVQRQVRAGTIDADEAVEMIRLFDETIAAPDTDADTAPDTDAADPPATDRPPMPARGQAAAAALLDRMRDRFGVEGPYDDHGGQTPSTPAGMIVDEQL